jgi:two-component system, NtrC family, response regulator AtoC
VSDATTIDATHLGGSPPDSPPDRAYLVVRRAESTQVIDLADGDIVLIGRSPDATIQVDDARVSREHARIRRAGSLLTIEDLGSRNGTRVGEHIVRRTTRPVGSGDVIVIGDAEIVVAETAAPATAGGRRLATELERLAVDSGGQAVLIRVAFDSGSAAEGMAALSPALGAATLVEAQAEGEYACLIAGGGTDATALIARLRALAPAAQVSAVRLPEDGTTLVELWQQACSPATPRPRRPAPPAPEGVVVADPAMVKVFHLVRKVAPTPTTVMILGETGVGKEVVTEQIHRHSPRAKQPFVRLSCGSLPETLLESELFGHEKGAFTGADRRKIGYLEAAHGGTLFLDEVGEIPLSMQAKLLRVLETRKLNRVGGTDEISVDVRIVSATHRDLVAESRTGRFREDLYFRLSAFVIQVPPLRERPAEIALLAELFARQFSERIGAPPPVIAPDAAAALRRHRWPGNVRELRNAIEHAVVLVEDDGVLRAEHLPESMLKDDSSGRPSAGAMREHLATVESKAIEEALEAEGGNQTRAAKRLGISRRALLYKIDKYNLRR